MQRLPLLAAAAALTALAGCGSISDRPGGSGVPANSFASNYPSVDPGAAGARREAGDRRRGPISPRPPAEVPF